MLVVLLLVLRSLLAGLGSRRELMLENLVLRHQLQVALRTNPRPRLRPSDRVLWVWLQSVWPDGWRHHLRLVRPETVLRWHRKGWRLYWTWRSRTRLGRPHLSAEVRALIARISKENPLWGSERIPGRTAEAWHRCQQPLDPAVSVAPTQAGRPPTLAHLPDQRAAWDLGRRPLRGRDGELPHPLCILPTPP
jgi:hypothetical protein